MPYISRYVYYGCTTLALGCIIYSDKQMTIPYSNKQIRIVFGGIGRVYTTSTTGTVIQITECSWTSTKYYTSPYTGTKNDCSGGSCSVVGSSVTLNDGTFANKYEPSATVTSYISQADADTKAMDAATAIFDANKQAQINSRGSCTYTYSSGSGTYSANFTKNNCGTDCYANGTVNYSITKTGYSASSTASCSAAITAANTAAYNAAVAQVNAEGQAYANANGSCCCWVADPACYLCYRYDDRQRNTCTGLYRNDYPTDSESCKCGAGCKGTNYDYYECTGTFGQDKLKRERYNCAPYDFTGATILEPCGCAGTAPDIRYLEPLEQTCIDCQLWYILRDFSVCSATAGHYFAKGYDYGFGKPSTAPCPDSGFDGFFLSVRCMDLGLTGLTTYNVYQNNNACGFRYRADGGGNSVYINSLSGTAGYCEPPVA